MLYSVFLCNFAPRKSFIEEFLMSKAIIRLAADTHVGCVRSNNEDNFNICCNLDSADWHSQKTAIEIIPNKYGVLAVIADGMGGALAGEVASAIATETMQSQFTPDNISKVIDSEERILQFIEESVEIANSHIIDYSIVHPETNGMGTTLVMTWFVNDKAYVCWCGDSRCYVYNANRGLFQLTHDHSYVQELVDTGKLSPEGMRSHPYANIITHCLGDVGNVAQSECHVYNMHDGDIFLLCSDGLTTMCCDKDIENIMAATGHNPSLCCERLISSALEAGGHDNVTIAICEYTTVQ